MAEAKRVFKKKTMVSSARYFFKEWKKWEEGDYVIGEFQGTKIDQFKKDCVLVKVYEASFQEDPKTAKNLKDKVIVLNSCQGIREYLKKSPQEGEMYQFNFKGYEKMVSGPFKGENKPLVEVEHLTEDDGDCRALVSDDFEAEDDEDGL